MIKKIINFKNNVTEKYNDGYFHLISKYNKSNGYFFQNNSLVFVTENLFNENKTITETKYLTLKTNFKLENVSNSNLDRFNEGNYNYIYFNDMNNFHLTRSFVNLCEYYFNNREYIPIDKFMLELAKLFDDQKLQDKLDEIGLFGELYLIYSLNDKHNIDLSNYWNIKGRYSKLDFVLEDINIEVKTTTSYELKTKIKHNQLFTKKNNYLCLVQIHENNFGLKLEELIDKIKKTSLSRNIKFMLNLEKILLNHSLSTNTYKVDNILFYNANDINHFKEIHNNISNLTYDYNLDDVNNMDISTFVRIIEKNITQK